MGAIADAWNTWLRSYVVDGVPASGVNPPDKAEGRAIGGLIEDALGPVSGVATKAADFTLALTDLGNWQEVSNASAVTLTIPANADVAFDVATMFEGAQAGAGAVNVVAASGVTLLVAENQTATTAGQGAVFGLKKIDTNVWRVFGNLVAA